MGCNLVGVSRRRWWCVAPKTKVLIEWFALYSWPTEGTTRIFDSGCNVLFRPFHFALGQYRRLRLFRLVLHG